MFEVIISHVRTGRIHRGFFATREEAEQYIAHFEDRLTCPPPNSRRKPQSLRDYRIETFHREAPTLRPLPVAVEAAAAA
jgi:hypothetical protein